MPVRSITPVVTSVMPWAKDTARMIEAMIIFARRTVHTDVRLSGYRTTINRSNVNAATSQAVQK